MIKKHSAFTMIELIFVIVVLGILAAIAIPRFGTVGVDAHVAKARSDVAAIRSAIVSERQARLLQGDSSYIANLDDATATLEGETLFDGNGTNLLQYGIISGTADGDWMKTAAGYTFTVSNTSVLFTYDQGAGRFSCDRVGNAADEVLCRRIVD